MLMLHTIGTLACRLINAELGVGTVINISQLFIKLGKLHTKDSIHWQGQRRLAQQAQK